MLMLVTPPFEIFVPPLQSGNEFLQSCDPLPKQSTLLKFSLLILLIEKVLRMYSLSISCCKIGFVGVALAGNGVVLNVEKRYHVDICTEMIEGRYIMGCGGSDISLGHLCHQGIVYVSENA
jgi:hypothetical protein